MITDTQYTHARFWKCALQVNPHSYSKRYQGQDHGIGPQAYAEKLLEVGRREKIKVVGLADHGSVQDVDQISDCLSLHGIVVFPGFEISSTEKVHMVCLFAEDTTTAMLERVLGHLKLMDPGKGVAPSSLGCLDIAKIIQDQGGFWYAAHMTGNNDRIDVTSPGTLLNRMTVEQARSGGAPRSRNEMMANAMVVRRLMERRGRGWLSMRRGMLEFNRTEPEPINDVEGRFTRVTFRLHPETQPSSEGE